MRPVRYCRSLASKWARALVCVCGGGTGPAAPGTAQPRHLAGSRGEATGRRPPAPGPAGRRGCAPAPRQVLPLRCRGRTGLWPHRHHHRHVSELLLPQVPADPLQPGSRPRAPRELKRGNRRKCHSRGSLAGSRAARPTGCTEEGLHAAPRCWWQITQLQHQLAVKMPLAPHKHTAQLSASEFCGFLELSP